MYHFRSRFIRYAMQCIDWCIPKAKEKSCSVKSVLIANGAHLGDVVLSTAVLPIIKERYPDAKIGFLIGSWSRCVIENHPLVDAIHIVDHWKLNRSGKNTYCKTRKQALGEIRGYDLAIDLYPYFPNSSLLFWQAKIPMRYGFTSGGFGALYTRRIDWKEEHILKAYERLLVAGPLLPNIPYLRHKGEYYVFHKEAGDKRKHWCEKKWEALARRYSDKKIIYSATENLTWQELVDLISGATHVVTVDTVVTHIAYATGTSCDTIHKGLGNPKVWMYGKCVPL